MKTKIADYLVVILGIVLTVCGMYGCSDGDIVNNELQNLSVISNSEGIVFPLTDGNVNSRTTSFEYDWEDYYSYKLRNGKSIELPWNPNYSSLNFTQTFARDIKKEDGWVMVFHTLEGFDSKEVNWNYIGFQNLATGVYKIFYYIESNPSPNNTGVWDIQFSRPCTWTYDADEITIPSCYDNLPSRTITISNPSILAGAFSDGWNCVEIPISYGPKPHNGIQLEIRAYNDNNSVLRGAMEQTAKTEGVLITHSTSNPIGDAVKAFTSCIGTHAGEKAASLIVRSDSAKGRSGRNLFSDLIGGGIKEFVNLGVGTLVNKLTGRFAKTVEIENPIKLSTKSEGTFSGSLTTTANSAIKSININVDLFGLIPGSWNLKEPPILYIHPVGVNVPNSLYYSLSADEVYYFFETTGRFKVDVDFNPALSPYLKKYWVKATPIVANRTDEKPVMPVQDYDYGSLTSDAVDGFFSDPYPEDLILGKYLHSGSLYTSKVNTGLDFKGTIAKYGIGENNVPYRYINGAENISMIRNGRKYHKQRYQLRVSLYMVTQFENKIDTVVSMRTYYPKLEWDPEMLRKYGGLSLNELQYDAKYDKLLNEIYRRNDPVNNTSRCVDNKIMYFEQIDYDYDSEECVDINEENIKVVKEYDNEKE